jgi:hypothetical protein
MTDRDRSPTPNGTFIEDAKRELHEICALRPLDTPVFNAATRALMALAALQTASETGSNNAAPQVDPGCKTGNTVSGESIPAPAGAAPPDLPMGDPHPCDMTPGERERFFAGSNDKVGQWLHENAPDCGDNSCLFGGRGKGGMRTNGGCRCFKDLPTAKRIYVERLFAAFTASATPPAKLDEIVSVLGGARVFLSEFSAAGNAHAPRLVRRIDKLLKMFANEADSGNEA